MNATDICNLSLSVLKTYPINDIDGSDHKSNLCKRWYRLKKRNLLAENNWRFAIKKIFLARNHFILPSDLVRVIGFNDNNEIESDLELYYVCDADESLFTRDFIQVLVMYLAHGLSYKLIGDMALTRTLEEKYQALLNRAKANGNIEYPLYYKNQWIE